MSPERPPATRWTVELIARIAREFNETSERVPKQKARSNAGTAAVNMRSCCSAHGTITSNAALMVPRKGTKCPPTSRAAAETIDFMPVIPRRLSVGRCTYARMMSLWAKART